MARLSRAPASVRLGPRIPAPTRSSLAQDPRRLVPRPDGRRRNVRRARDRACRPDVRCQGRDHRRGDTRRDVGLPLQGRSGLCRGEEVHAQRLQGLQPERDLVEGQERHGQRLGGHLPRPRQWLAQPVSEGLRVHDQGRVRPERDGRQWRQQHQVLRRAIRLHARSGAERRHPAPSPLLRVGQLGARQPGAHPLGRQAARRQLRGGLPHGPAPVPSSPTATAERSITCAPCSPPTSAWSTCGAPSPTTTATSSRSRPPERRARPRSWIRTRRPRATTAPWSATRT